MKLRIPKEESFNCPQGNFAATLVDIKPYQESVRFIWVPDCKETKNIQYKAAAKYKPTLERGSRLRTDLEILGIEFKGEELDLKTLLGIRADVEVSHLQGEKYEIPFVFVSRVAPLGTLTNN